MCLFLSFFFMTKYCKKVQRKKPVDFRCILVLKCLLKYILYLKNHVIYVNQVVKYPLSRMCDPTETTGLFSLSYQKQSFKSCLNEASRVDVRDCSELGKASAFIKLTRVFTMVTLSSPCSWDDSLFYSRSSQQFFSVKSLINMYASEHTSEWIVQ